MASRTDHRRHKLAFAAPGFAAGVAVGVAGLLILAIAAAIVMVSVSDASAWFGPVDGWFVVKTAIVTVAVLGTAVASMLALRAKMDSAAVDIAIDDLAAAIAHEKRRPRAPD